MDSENENRFSILKNTAAGSFFRVFSSFLEKKHLQVADTGFLAFCK